MWMTWHDLLFAHWPIPVEAMRRAVPASLALDTFDGLAWVGVVPFRMSGVRPRFVPSLPWLSAFPELNVRTYVTFGGKPGVYFFSLEAANPVAVRAARTFFHLPYFDARMSLHDTNDWIDYKSHRTHRSAPPADFAGRYRPTGPVQHAAPGSIDAWLTERYCLYSQDPRGRLYRSEIHHLRWPLQPAEAEIETDSMTRPPGLARPDVRPILHFARRLEVAAWAIQRL
jgi:uncharacterized protein YqjF (DUF2071 family)